MSIDLSTTYLGLELNGPIIASASPLTGKLPSLKALEDAGAAAVVLPSLFEEEVAAEEFAVAKGHVVAPNGQSLAVELRPGTGAALMSLSAYQALGIGLTELPEMVIFGS